MAKGGQHTEQPISRLFLSPPFPTSPTDRQAAHWLTCLNQDERNILANYQGKRHIEYLLSRALLRHALTATIAPEQPLDTWTIDYPADSPPALTAVAAQGWHCSLAHSRKRVAVALSNRGACGIDIECHRPRHNRPQLAQTYFTAGEQAFLEQLPETERETAFYRLWTLKEAWYKADGRRAFSSILGGLDFSETSDQTALQTPLQAWWQELDGFSLAFAGNVPPTSLWQGWPDQEGKNAPGRFTGVQPVETGAQ